MATTSNVLSSKSIWHASPRTKLTGMPAHFSRPFSNILSERSSATISPHAPKPAYISLANAPSRVATSSAFPIWSGESSCRSLSMRDPSCYSVYYNGKCLIRQCLPPAREPAFFIIPARRRICKYELAELRFSAAVAYRQPFGSGYVHLFPHFYRFSVFPVFSKKGLHFSDGCAILFF